jgi:hypothetical protein
MLALLFRLKDYLEQHICPETQSSPPAPLATGVFVPGQVVSIVPPP